MLLSTMYISSRLVQQILVGLLLLITLAIFGETSTLAVGIVNEMGCSISQKLAYNIALVSPNTLASPTAPNLSTSRPQ